MSSTAPAVCELDSRAHHDVSDGFDESSDRPTFA
jgi:hypothetical protein